MSKKKPDYTVAQQLRDQGYTIVEIATKTGLCRFGIGKNTVKNTSSVRSKKATKNVIKKVSEATPKMRKEAASEMSKGHAKLNKNQKVIESRVIDESSLRRVWIPSMNMLVSVKASDTRSDAQIAEFWANKNKRDLKSLPTPYLPKTKQKCQ